MGANAVHIEDLGRIYKVRGPKHKGDARTLVALEHIDLNIERGELFGLLGPNGAGKTTLLKILSTLLLPTSGSARVEGLDVVKQAHGIRHLICMVSGGETSGYGLLTVEENLWMFARFYGLDNRTARQRIGQFLEVMGLADRRRTKISDLSTGLRQKMNFIRGFISDPKVVFLDEPTLGLDVSAARVMRQFVKDWMKAHPDRTILLTTHYMAEADQLCDRLAIIDRGRLLACDTPDALKRGLQREVIYSLKITLGAQELTRERLQQVEGVRQVTITPSSNGYLELALILAHDEALTRVLAFLNGQKSSLISLDKHEPTLEDVFIERVGRGLDVDTSKRGLHE
ncbi:MAG TPA: ABC transporter ATP-binding protein [Candidatus Bipolaricaulota bacterium]